MTPTLSVDAAHATVALVAVAEVTRKFDGAVGAVVSWVCGVVGGGVVVVLVTVALTVFLAIWAPASSRARTSKVC